jgi:flagellar hook protein FlgE
MRKSLLLLSLLLAGACVDVTIDNGEHGTDDTSTGTVACRSGATDGGALGDGVALGGDSSTFRPPRATDSITLRGNLDHSAIPLSWDATTPKATSNFTTTVVVYDSVGKAIQLDFYFGKKDDVGSKTSDFSDWTYHVMTDGLNLGLQSNGKSHTNPGTLYPIAEGGLRFDTMGRLVFNVTTSQGFYPAGAVGPQILTLNFGTGTESGGSGLDGITQYAATSAITFVDQSGWAASL